MFYKKFYKIFLFKDIGDHMVGKRKSTIFYKKGGFLRCKEFDGVKFLCCSS